MSTHDRKPDDAPAGWPTDWQLRIRLWVERDGEPVLGKGRADLLDAIARTRSISAAARALGMSYRHAWKLVQEANAAAAAPLVTSAVGGARGGGAALTAHGRMAVDIFRRLERDVRNDAAAIMRRALDTAHAGDTTTLHVAVAISLQEAFAQAVTEYALLRPTVRIHAVFGASNELAQQAQAGAAFDLLVSAGSDQVTALAAAGLVAADDAVAIAANRLAALATTTPTTARQVQARLASGGEPVVIAAPEVPVGAAWKRALVARGWYDTLRPRLVTVDDSRSVPVALVAGRAALGLGFATDAASTRGIEPAWTPSGGDSLVAYHAAVLLASPGAAEAARFVAFLTSPQARRVWRRCGLEPMGGEHRGRRPSSKGRS
jgi:molybdenum ABC transporter molybdate-binding protein